MYKRRIVFNKSAEILNLLFVHLKFIPRQIDILQFSVHGEILNKWVHAFRPKIAPADIDFIELFHDHHQIEKGLVNKHLIYESKRGDIALLPDDVHHFSKDLRLNIAIFNS